MPSEQPIGSAGEGSAPSSEANNPDRSDAVESKQDSAAAPSAESDASPEPAPPVVPLADGSAPSVVGISRLSRRPFLSDSAESLYRHVARSLEIPPEAEFVVTPCGQGVSTRFLAQITGAAGSGVDPDPDMVDEAQERARRSDMLERLHFDVAPINDLPYQDDVFDFGMGEIGLGASGDPAGAVRELVRVVKPMAPVVLLQLVWTRQLDPPRRDQLVRQLGVRPMLLVEWKQLLRDAGVVDLHVEDLSDQAATPRQPLLGVAGLTDFFYLRDKLGVLYRAWQEWGWQGVFETLRHGNDVRYLIERERVLGLSLIRGTKWRASGEQTNTDGDRDGELGREAE